MNSRSCVLRKQYRSLIWQLHSECIILFPHREASNFMRYSAKTFCHLLKTQPLIRIDFGRGYVYGRGNYLKHSNLNMMSNTNQERSLDGGQMDVLVHLWWINNRYQWWTVPMTSIPNPFRTCLTINPMSRNGTAYIGNMTFWGETVRTETHDELECVKYNVIFEAATLTFSVFYLRLSNVSANDRRYYIWHVFYHWLRSCSATDRKRVLIQPWVP